MRRVTFSNWIFKLSEFVWLPAPKIRNFQMQPQYVSTITTTTVSGPPSYEKLDQPPTYDETDLRVNIPGKERAFSLPSILESRRVADLKGIQWT